MLVALGLLVLAGEAAVNRRGRLVRVGSQATRPPTRAPLRWARIPAIVGLVCLVGLALVLPVGVIVYWLRSGQSTTLPATSIISAAVRTAVYAALAGLLATGAALPIALVAVRYRSRLGRLFERSTYVVQSLPGLVIALSLVFFAINYAFRMYQTSALLIVAYAILFFPLALICVLASAGQAPTGLEEVARSLGSRPLAAFRRVTVPLIAPGLAAGFCLVFLSAVTELTATLILIPTGAHTLASQFWNYESNASYGAAAPYAAMLVGVAVVPSYLITRWFDRRTRSGTIRIAVDESVSPLGRA